MRPEGYYGFLEDLKQRIRTAQVRAVLAVNRELILLYWQIGREILERQDRAGWGAKIIESLASDLHREFPDMKGFSRTNLLYMRAFAEAWPDEPFVQQVVGQIPWGHNLRILDLVKTRPEREWYIRQTVQNGWSRNVLVLQIESGLYRRQGKAQTNFSATLPAPQSDLAQQVLKDPYNFDFLMLAEDARERELESGLLEHLRKFLLELGVGFAFIGVILCKSRNVVVAEYALRDTAKPIGISEYVATVSLPADLKGSLPTVEELEAELKHGEARDTTGRDVTPSR
jgi:predicted nuclease of restriction endonuclease-like (RecB) superfamily